MNDCQMITELKQRKNIAFHTLYTFYYPIIEQYICANSGSTDDAKDVFQETLIILLNKVTQHDFELTSSLKTFLYAVASNIWLKKIRKSKKRKGYLQDPDATNHILQKWEQQEEETAKSIMLQQALQTVSGHCQKLLLKTFAEENTRATLIKEMGYKNTHSFNNQKYKCLLQARKFKKTKN